MFLQKRGIPVCDEGTNAIQGASSDDQEDELYDDDATNAVAAAAVTALYAFLIQQSALTHTL
jgi:hypothetical protein